MHWVRDIAIVLALIWLLLVALTTARAQEPTPETPACQGVETDGGQTLIIANVQITFPEGNFTRSIASPTDPDLAFSVCHVETGAKIAISGTDCKEISRETDSEAGEAVLDELVGSCIQVPPNEPPGDYGNCPPGGSPVDGGQTIDVQGQVQVTLPPGNFSLQVTDETVLICQPEMNFVTSRRLSDCSTATIIPPVEELIALDAQIECVALNPPPAPTTPPFTANPNIQPPNTGDGGLLIR